MLCGVGVTLTLSAGADSSRISPLVTPLWQGQLWCRIISLTFRWRTDLTNLLDSSTLSLFLLIYRSAHVSPLSDTFRAFRLTKVLRSCPKSVPREPIVPACFPEYDPHYVDFQLLGNFAGICATCNFAVRT